MIGMPGTNGSLYNHGIRTWPTKDKIGQKHPKMTEKRCKTTKMQNHPKVIQNKYKLTQIERCKIITKNIDQI